MSERPTTIWGIDPAAATGLATFLLVYFGGLVVSSFVGAYADGVGTPEQRLARVSGNLLAGVLVGLPAMGCHAMALAWVRRNFRPLRLVPVLAMQCLVAAASVVPFYRGSLDSGWRIAAFMTAPANLTLLLYGGVEAFQRWLEQRAVRSRMIIERDQP